MYLIIINRIDHSKVVLHKWMKDSTVRLVVIFFYYPVTLVLWIFIPIFHVKVIFSDLCSSCLGWVVIAGYWGAPDGWMKFLRSQFNVRDTAIWVLQEFKLSYPRNEALSSYVVQFYRGGSGRHEVIFVVAGGLLQSLLWY